MERHSRFSERHHNHGIFDSKVWVGIIVIAIGVIALLDNLDLIENVDIWDYWPVILIIIGIEHLFKPREYRRYLEGLIWIIIGALFLVNNISKINLSFNKYWPLLLVLVGIVIIVHGFSDHYRKGEIYDSDFINISNILGGGDYIFDSKNLRGGKVNAFMGGSKIDLRKADMPGDSIVIDVFAIMGGVDLIVPSSWRVIIQVTPILGGVEDKTARTSDEGKSAKGRLKQLVIKGIVIMGGVDVKN